jgi:cell division protein FtsN
MGDENTPNKKKILPLAVGVAVLLILILLAGFLVRSMLRRSEPLARNTAPETARLNVYYPIIRPAPTLATQETLPIAPSATVPAMPEPLALRPAEKADGAAMAYAVQVGAFLNHIYAEQFRGELIRKGYTPYIFQAADTRSQTWYTVRIGDYQDLGQASAAVTQFTAAENLPAVVTRYNSLAPVRITAGQ